MIDNNIKQKDIANTTGLSRQTISNLLNGRNTNMTFNSIFNLTNAIGAKIDLTLFKSKDNTTAENTDNTPKDN